MYVFLLLSQALSCYFSRLFITWIFWNDAGYSHSFRSAKSLSVCSNPFRFKGSVGRSQGPNNNVYVMQVGSLIFYFWHSDCSLNRVRQRVIARKKPPLLDLCHSSQRNLWAKMPKEASRGSWHLAWLDSYYIFWQKKKQKKQKDEMLSFSAKPVVMTCGRTSFIVKDDPVPDLNGGEKRLVYPFPLPRLHEPAVGSWKRRLLSSWNALQFLTFLFSFRRVQVLNWNDLNMVISQSDASFQAHNQEIKVINIENIEAIAYFENKQAACLKRANGMARHLT